MGFDEAKARLPPTVENVRRTCAKLVTLPSSSVHVDEEALSSFVANFDLSLLKDHEDAMRFPLSFPDRDSEINFICVLHLLNFGSGFRHLLHAANGRGAWQTMVFGLMGMHIAGKALSAVFLRDISLLDVSGFFALPLDEEEKLNEAVFVSKPGPLRPLAEMIVKAMNQSGSALVDLGYRDFAQFVRTTVEQDREARAGAGGGGEGGARETGEGTAAGGAEGQEGVEQDTATDQPSTESGPSSGPSSSSSSSEPPPSALALVRALAETFSALDDRVSIPSFGDVLLLKKAQIMVSELHRRFREEERETFDFFDGEAMTIFSDNVVPCVMRHLGLLTLSEELAARIDAGLDLPQGKEEAELRAAALYACQRLRELSQGRMAEVTLAHYFWNLGKDPNFRPKQRHATKDTWFY